MLKYKLDDNLLEALGNIYCASKRKDREISFEKYLSEAIEKFLEKKGKEETADCRLTEEWRVEGVDLNIKSVDNGFILRYKTDENEDRLVIIEDQTIKARTAQRLLYEVGEYFGLMGSKHDSERCVVLIKKQKG